MKSFTLKKKSWHYWLAEHGGLNALHSTDICTYIRAVIWGAVGGACQLVLLTAAAVLVVGLALILLGGAGWLFWCLFTLTWQPAWEIVTAGATMDLILGASVVATFVTSWRRERKQLKKAKEPKQHSFLVLAAKSITGKFCVKINLE